MERESLSKSVKYDNYDDIYPSIVKQQPSYFKSLCLCLSLCSARFWHKISNIKHTGCVR